MQILKVTTKEQLQVVADLASAIWPVAYATILSKEQLHYMLDKFYNLEALQKQLENGQVFDSSYKRKQPIDFTLGMGQVIEGWDEGISLLQVGDKARFVIPANLAYGESGAGGVIPPNATLIFDVELMGVN